MEARQVLQPPSASPSSSMYKKPCTNQAADGGVSASPTLCGLGEDGLNHIAAFIDDETLSSLYQKGFITTFARNVRKVTISWKKPDCRALTLVRKLRRHTSLEELIVKGNKEAIPAIAI